MVIEQSETMGCGCSISPRQVNPSESPSSSIDRSWVKKPNGGTTSAESRISSELSSSSRVVHCGVDTRSLEGFLETYLTEFRDSKAVQCDFISWKDASTSPRPGHQVTSGRKRITEVEGSDSLHRSFSTETLWRYADSPVGLKNREVVSIESNGNLREYLSRTSGFQSPVFGAKASSLSYRDITGPEVSDQELSLGSPEKDINANPLPLDGSKTEMSYQTSLLTEQTQWPPEFQPRPPMARKEQLLCKMSFEKVDRHSAEVPDYALKTVRSLVKFLTASARNDLEKTRAFYYWIGHNIRYDVNCADLRMTPQDTLESGVGVCRNFCRLFSEMCRFAGIRVQEIGGFVKGFDYSLGHRFKPDEDVRYFWNAAFLNGFWRFFDCTWGAGILNTLGRFQQKFNEHFFMPDPDEFSWTHFPYRASEENYSRWQLLETPQTLDDFNAKPKVTPYLFNYSIKILSTIEDPLLFAHSTEILLSAPQVMRYKYKFYPLGSVESKRLNAFVFCQLKNNRMVGSFKVTPPEEDDYLLKIYAKPESGIATEASILNSVTSMVLRCTKTHKNVPRLPFHDGPWGITSHLEEYGLHFANVPLETPVLVTVNGRRTVLLEVPQEMLISQQLFDIAGNAIGAKNIIHRVAKMEDKIIRFVIHPPRRGFYKFVVYARPKPTTKGRWYLPCIANFLVDCRQESLNTGILLRPKKSIR